MRLIKNVDTGKYGLLDLEPEDVGGLYFAALDYASRLKMERATGLMGGVPIGPEDVAFLDEVIPKAKRVCGRFEELEELLNQEGLI